MKIVVTGRVGQIAKSLDMIFGQVPEHDLIFLGRPEFDLSDLANIEEQICMHNPDIVVSAAAYTAVDMAEDEEDLALAINAIGAGAVAAASKKCSASIIIFLRTMFLMAQKKCLMLKATLQTHCQCMVAQSLLVKSLWRKRILGT